MTDELIPEEVQAFLPEHLEKQEQPLVLKLITSRPGEDWDVERAGKSVRLPAGEAERALEELTKKNLATRKVEKGVPTFTYSARAPTTETIERLSQLYTSEPLEIMRLLNANAIERVRSSMARSFASAFIVGRKK